MAIPSSAQLLDELFKTHLHPDGREYTYVEVAAAINQDAANIAADRRIDASTITKVRNGMILNPGRETILVLCRFFGVPSAYFFPELNDLPPSSLNDLGVTLRGLGLDADVRKYLLGLIQALCSSDAAEDASSK